MFGTKSKTKSNRSAIRLSVTSESRWNRNCRGEPLEDRRLLAAGDLDPTFGVGGILISPVSADHDLVRAVAVQADNKIVAVGQANINSHYHFAIARFLPNGGLDPTFNGTGIALAPFTQSDSDGASDVANQPDGKIVVAGYAYIQQQYAFALVRYNADGTLDSTFGLGGVVSTALSASSDAGFSMRLQSDGKIVVGGMSYNLGSTAAGGHRDFALARYNSNGSLDATFGQRGTTVVSLSPRNDQINSIDVQADGKIVAVGSADVAGVARTAIARFNANGSLDGSFGNAGSIVTQNGEEFIVRSAELLPDGRIVVAGHTRTNSLDYLTLLRFTSLGIPDPTFDGDGKVVSTRGEQYGGALALMVQSDGKYVVAGGSGDDFSLSRYNVDGTLDTTFDFDGRVTTSLSSGADHVYALAAAPNDTIVAAGYAQNGNWYDFALARYFQNGASVVAVDDAGSSGYELSTIIDVLANDSAPNGLDPASLQIVAQPQSGSVSVDFESGTVTYIPDQGFFGSDQFSYTVRDVLGVISNVANVSVDIDPPGELSIGDVTVAEGNSGVVNAVFTVTLSPAQQTTVTVDFATADNSAVANSDYSPGFGHLTFAAGTVSRQITVSILADSNIEPNETFSVNLLNPNGPAIISDPQGIGTIINDDAFNPPPVALDDFGSSTYESFTIIDILDNDSDSNGLNPASVQIVAQPLSGTVSVNSITGEVTYIPDLGFIGNDQFSYTARDTLGALSNVATVSIDVDPPLSAALSINDVAVTEGDSGIVVAVFTVTLFPAQQGIVTVDFFTTDDTATESVDYFAEFGQLTFDTGTVAQQITVSILADSTFEPNETFFVNLTNPNGPAIIFDPQGIGGIINDDPPNAPPVAFDDLAGVNQDVPAVFSILDNDTDDAFALDPASIQIIDQPSNGSVFVDPSTGTVTYTPDSGYTGGDQFSYTVKDDLGATSNEADVDLQVGTYDVGQAIVTDGNGNVFVAGRFAGAADFDPGADTTELIAPDPLSSSAFLTKYDSNGALLWALQRDDIPVGIDGLAADTAGNVHIAGGNVLAKFDGNGNQLWSHSLLSADLSTTGVEFKSLAVDAGGNVFGVGELFATTDFDPGPGVSELAPIGGNDAVVVKLDESGNFVWARQFGGSGANAHAYGAAADASGNIYLAGAFLGTVDFDPEAADQSITSNGSLDAFVLNLDIAGALVWVRTVGSGNDDRATALALDGSANVYVTGEYSGNVDFSVPGTVGFAGGFVWKLDASAIPLWVYTSGAVGFADATAITVEESCCPPVSGTVTITGSFDIAVDFDLVGSGDVRISAGQGDVFVTQLDLDGNYLQTITVGGAGDDAGLAVAAYTPTDNLYVTGYFQDTVDFDPDFHVPSATVSTQNDFDIFVWTLEFGAFLDVFTIGGEYSNTGGGNALVAPVGSANPLDVNQDGAVNALDVLIVVNALNDVARNSTLLSAGQTARPAFDVNGDGIISAVDVLLVVNHLNQPAAFASTTANSAPAVVQASSLPATAPAIAQPSPAVTADNFEVANESVAAEPTKQINTRQRALLADLSVIDWNQSGRKFDAFETNVDACLEDFALARASDWKRPRLSPRAGQRSF